MNTIKKITIRGQKGTHSIQYPNQEAYDVAMKTIEMLKGTKRILVPCDIESGITEKVVKLTKYTIS